MLIAHHSTATAITPHARDRNWVVFLWLVLPGNMTSPIRIAAIKGADISKEMRRLSAANAFDVQIIGMIPSADATTHAKAIGEQYGGQHLHDGWYASSPGLLAFIEHHAASELDALLSKVHPGSIYKDVVDIEELSRLLNISVPTIRRMIKSKQIPKLQCGKRSYRFVPADVIASLRINGR